MSNLILLRRLHKTPQPPTPTLVLSKVVLCVMPIVDIAVGAVYLNDCPRQHYIPIYLIVTGVFAFMLAVLSCLPFTHEATEGSQNPLSRVCRVWNTLISIFLLSWFIAGSVWVYSIYEPNYRKNATNDHSYCDRTLYQFTFWTITIVYILMAISLVIGICSLIFSCLCGKSDANKDVERQTEE